MIESYLAFLKDVRMLKAKTINEYRFMLRRMATEIDFLHPGSQADIERAILRQKKIGNCKGREWSTNYCSKVSGGILLPFFAWLSSENHIPFNPYLYNRFKKERMREPEYLTEEKFAEVLEEPMLEAQERVFLMLAWDTGARLSELCGLDFGDVNLKEHYIVIHMEKSKGGYGGRVVPFTRKTSALIEEHIGKLREYSDREYLFVNSEFGRLGSVTVNNMTSRIRAWLSRKHKKPVPFHMHMLRHSWARRFLNAGGDHMMGMKFLGHASETMFKHYSHFTTKDLRKVYDEMMAAK